MIPMRENVPLCGATVSGGVMCPKILKRCCACARVSSANSRSVWADSLPCLNEVRQHGWRESADRMVLRGPLWLAWPRHQHTVFYCNALAIFCLSHIPTWSLIRLPAHLTTTTCLTGTFNDKKRFYLSLLFAPIPQCIFCLKNTL